MVKLVDKKIAAFVLLITFLVCVQPRQSEAFVPALIVPAVLGAVILTTAAITYYKPASLPASWPGKGMLTTGLNIARIAIGAQVATSKYALQELKGDYVAFKANVASAYSKLSGSTVEQGKYPALWSFVSTTSAPPITVNSNIGDVVNVPGFGNRTVVNKFTMGCATPGLNQRYNNGDAWIFSGAGGSGGCPSGAALATVVAYSGNTVTVPPRPRTTGELQQAAPNGVMPDAAMDDLDRAIAENANGYGVSIVDAATPGAVDNAPPFVPPIIPPSTSLDPAQPTVTPGEGAATQANVANSAANSSAATQAYKDAMAARDAYANSHPGATRANDPVLAGLEDAVTSAGQAAQAATNTAQNVKDSSEEKYPNPANDSLKDIDWSPFNALKGAVSNVWPFTLLASLAGYYSQLTTSPTAPCFTFPLPLGYSLTIDLAPYNSVAAICRYLVAVIITTGAILYIVRFWRGVE